MRSLFRSLNVLLCLTSFACAGVWVSAPAHNSNVATSVQFVANAKTSCSKGISGMGIYTAPGKLAYLVHSSNLNTVLKFNPGTYDTVVQEWDHCGWTSKTLVRIHVQGSSTNGIPRSNHVWLITEENRSYESVIGSKYMPYFNSLASKYALAAQYYANRHSSLPALMWLVAGQDVTTNNNTTSCFNVDNVVRHLLVRGMTWKSYQEDLPYSGFTGLGWANYVRRHNPLIDFTDVCAPSQKYNSVPYSHLAKDIANHSTPNYAYITPNLQHDAHDGSRAQADAWLAKEVPKILSLPEFQSGGDGLLFIVFDEGDLYVDNRCNAWTPKWCGGRVATLVIGPKVKRGFKSNVLYHHQNLLRTVCDAMGFGSCPGGGANAAPMSDFF